MVVINVLLSVLVLTFVFGALIALDLTEKSAQKWAEKQKRFDARIESARKQIESV